MKNLVKMTIIFLVIFSISQSAYSQIVPTDGTVYVKADGTGNGSSWATATSDLQGAIDADGVARVWIAEGTYYPTWQWDLSDPRAFSFKMKNGVLIFGGFPDTGDPTMSDMSPSVNIVTLSGDLGVLADYSDNAYHVIYNMADLALNQTAYISGVNIKFGNANGLDGDNNRGGGVHNDNCSPTFYNCKISHNYGIRGAGMYNWESSPTLSTTDFNYNEAAETGGGILNSSNSSPILNYCYIISNTAVVYGAGIANVDNCHPVLTQCFISANDSDGSAGGILNSENSNPHIESCKIINNKAAQYGGGILNNQSKPLIVNCIISNNEAILAGGGMLNNENSNPSIINNTIVQNIAGVFGSSIANDDSSPNITNCIIWDNNSDMYNQGTSNPQVTYSCVENSYVGTGNISDDPLFTSNSISDFYLQFSSPAINAGINDSVPIGVVEDANFKERILNGVVDMGAYELSGIIYVKQSALGNDDGTSWYNAYTSLESALDAASDGCEIWVAAGTYLPSNDYGLGVGNRYKTFKLKAGVHLYGGFAGNEDSLESRNWNINKAILDGNLGAEKVYHVVYAGSDCNEETILDGITIRNGQAGGSSSFRNGANIYVSGSSPIFRNLSIYSGICGNYGANVYVENSSALFENCNITSGSSDYQGGGVALYNSSAKFNYCEISDNYAYGLGGGVNVAGTGVNVFNSCSFTENRADDMGAGGAFYVESSVTDLILVNCFFTENSADVSGGAIDISGTAKIVNCTFGSNYANDLGAMGGHIIVRASGILDVYNSVLTDGYADLGEQIHAVAGAQLSISHSMIQDCGGSGASWDSDLGVDAGGNIDFNSFWFNYQTAIDNEWPGIDAGSSNVFNDITDLNSIILDADEFPRFRGYDIDMGHLEIPYAKLTVFITPTEAADIAEWTYDSWIDSFYSGQSFWKTPETLTIEFSDVDGYNTPSPSVVDMEWGHDYDVYGNYVVVTNLEQTYSDNTFSVYPNPAESTLYFSFANGKANENINIFTADGKLVKSVNAELSNQIEISDLSSGLYFIKYQNQTVKLIKK
jgi:hypothetical protein